MRNYCIAIQPSLYLAQAALLRLLHRKDVLGAFGPADLITWTSNVTSVTVGAMDRVFVEELVGINAAKNGGILFNPFNLLSSQPISMTDYPPMSSCCCTLLSPLPPSVVKIFVVVIVVIVAVARYLPPHLTAHSPPSRCLTMRHPLRSSTTLTVADSLL